MLIRETVAQRAAIRFRRLYLECLSVGKIDSQNAWRLTKQFSCAIWFSKEVVALIVITSAMLLFTMPLGSDHLTLAMRVTYFSLVILSTIFGCFALLLPIGFFRIRGWLNSWVAGGLSVFLVVVWYAFCFVLYCYVLSLELQFSFFEILLRSGAGMSIAMLFSFAVSPYTLTKLMRKKSGREDFSKLISKEKQGSLISISAQDHYVSIMTSRGTELLLMKISDAIKLVELSVGLQIHRSHWVAISAIKAVDERARIVELQNGATLPVAPAYMAALTLELSRRDVLSQQERLFERTEFETGLLNKLVKANIKSQKLLDKSFLEIFQGKTLSERKRLSLAAQIRTYSTTSTIFILTQAVHFVNLSAMQPFGLDAVAWYHPFLFWLLVYGIMSITIIPAHIAVWYVDLKFGSKAWIGISLAIAYESLLALAIVPPLAQFLFGPVFVSPFAFFVSTFLMLLCIVPNLYMGVRNQQSYHSWKKALNIPPLIFMLPYETRGELISISANKREVNVRTTTGETTVKKKFGDALTMLGGRQGIQVHRSHWVAAPYIKGRCIDGALNFVELTTGDLVPLAAANIDKVDQQLRCAK